jgi:hypothetical protein
MFPLFWFHKKAMGLQASKMSARDITGWSYRAKRSSLNGWFLEGQSFHAQETREGIV